MAAISQFKSDEERIEWSARNSNKLLYEKYPSGCDEDQAREFFSTQPYPTIAWAKLIGNDDDVQEAIKELLNK